MRGGKKMEAWASICFFLDALCATLASIMVDFWVVVALLWSNGFIHLP